jgi:hypothetical protein
MGNERETSLNLLQKLRSTRHKLRVSMGYISPRALMTLTAVTEPPNQKKEEPMWTLCLDSPTVMTSLCSKALDTGLFTFSFGCAPHALHNLCMDYLKLDSFKTVISKHLYMVKEIKKVHLLSSTRFYARYLSTPKIALNNFLKENTVQTHCFFVVARRP